MDNALWDNVTSAVTVTYECMVSERVIISLIVIRSIDRMIVKATTGSQNAKGCCDR